MTGTDTDQPIGLAAMAAAEEGGPTPPALGREIPGKDASEVSNPYAGQFRSGTAQETNEELVSRMTDGREAPNVVPPPGTGPGDVTKPGNAGQQPTDAERSELQAKNDRLQTEMGRLQEEATVGRYVMGDNRLAGIVTDSMRGVTNQPGMGGMGHDDSLRKSLGLPDDFIFNPDEMYIQGTASQMYYDASINMAVDAKVDKRVEAMRQEEDMKAQGAIVRERFLAANHSEEDLQNLMSWVKDGGNFTLEKLWSYMMGLEAPVSGADLTAPAPSKQHVSSIGGMAGAGIVPEIPADVQVAVDLLKESSKRVKPF